MKTFSLSLSLLTAARTHCAEKDPRYYLKGLQIDMPRGRIVATDGKRLFIAGVPALSDVPAFIVPLELLDQVLKAMKKADTVEITTDGKAFAFAGAGVVVNGKALDATFPDIDRVIPDTVSGEVAQYDAEFIAQATKALRLATNSKKTTLFPLHHNGSSAGVMLGAQENGLPVVIVIMPYRCDSTLTEAMAYCRAVKTRAPSTDAQAA